MRKILLLVILNTLTVSVSAGDPKPLATMQYEYCNSKGLVCSGEGTIEKGIDSLGNSYEVISGDMESNEELLINLDHYYSKICQKELGLPLESSIPKNLFKPWIGCVIEHMSNAVREKNNQNTQYIENLKKLLN